MWLDNSAISDDWADILLAALANLDPTYRGVLDSLDHALRTLLKGPMADKAVAFIETYVDQRPVPLEVFDGFMRGLLEGPPDRLNRIFVRWMIGRVQPLAQGFADALRGREMAGEPVPLSLAGLDLTASQAVRLAKRAVGYFFVQPVTAASILVAVLREGPSEALEAARQLLFDPLLVNYGGKTRDYLQTLASYGSRQVGGGDPEFKATLVNGGVVFQPAEGLRAYASYAEGYTVPDVGRILRGINIPNQDVDTYLAIEPIVSNNREIGAEFKRGPFDAGVTYFWSKSKLGQFLVRNAGGIFDVQRQGVAIEGLEVNVKARTPVPGLEVSTGYARLRGQTDTNRDGKVDTDLDGANISPDRLNLAADYQTGKWALRLQVQNYMSRNMQRTKPLARHG